MKDVIVVIGPGQIGLAIARRIGAGKHLVLADRNPENARAAADVLSNVGYDPSIVTVDVSSRKDVHGLVDAATARGNVTGVIHAAGVSPTQASPATILKVDLYGTALILEEFGNVAKRIPQARVVSAFNTVPSEVLFGVSYASRRKTARPSLVYCGDDKRAKSLTADLIQDVGFETSRRRGATNRAIHRTVRAAHG